MKRVCTNCGQVSPHGNAWCQNRDCPSGTLTTVFDYGDFLGDIQIVRLISILRTATIYEAKRLKDTVYLKVAHDDCQDQIKREAALLAALGPGGNPFLPKLLSPYPFAEGTPRPYGKTAFQDETKYYLVFEYIKGEILRDMLIKNPQPWYQHAAWIVVDIADAIAFMNVKGSKLDLNITPDTILIRTDKQGIPRPILLDLGAVADPGAVNPAWVQKYALPAYTPPELLDRMGPVGTTAEVYGLGLLMYEMLAGHPAYPFALRKDENVREDVRTKLPPPLNRTDLAEDVAAIVMQAIDKVPTRRFTDVITFAKALRLKFGEVPAEKKGIQLISRRQFAIGLSSALLLTVLIVLGVVLQNAHIFNF